MRKNDLGRLGVTLALAAGLVLGSLAAAPTLAAADEGEPSGGAAAPASVAMVGDVEYATFDEAVEAAADGGTVTLLADATTAGLNLGKNLTVDGGGKTLTFDSKGIALWGKTLTFKNVNVVMSGIGSTPYGEWTWMAVCASNNSSLVLEDATMTIDGTGTNNAHCIYFTGNNKLNLTGSTLTIKNYRQDALEWDGGDGGYNVNFTNSTFVSDHNRSGFTGTFYVTSDNSNVSVVNSTGNGSNGSHFIFKNGSVVDFSNNAAHGLSTGILTVENSAVTAKDNGYNGIVMNNKGAFTNADVTVSGTKGKSYWNGGIRLLGANASLAVDSTTKLTIQDNFVTGLFMDAKTSLAIEDGAQVLITGNQAEQANCSTKKDLAQSGGGITVRSEAKASLPASAKVYNNSASVAGDDIYVEDGGTITFDGAQNDGSLGLTVKDEGEHAIVGWYVDGAGARWSAHGDTINVKEIEPGTKAGVFAAKSAHGVASVTYQWVSTENPDGVNPPTDDAGLEIGAAYTAKAQDPAKGWSFDGWYLDEGLTNKFVDGTALTGDVTLYGRWTTDPVEPSKPGAPTTPVAPDKPAPTTPDTPDKPAPTKKGIPQTGDPSSVVASIAGIVAASGVAAAAAGIALRKKDGTK